MSVIDVGYITGSADTMLVVSVSVRGTYVKSVTAVITASNGSSISELLLDSGLMPDQKLNDGIYSGYMPLHLTKAVVGQYTIQIQASDDRGQLSNRIGLPVSIISSNNRPPIISQLIAPDTVVVPAAGSEPNFIKVSVVVTDTDGLGNIDVVSFISYRPDGSIVPGSFIMLDDGGVTTGGSVSSDDVSGDGRFTLKLQLPAGTPGKTYRDFVFTAKDKSGGISNLLTKRIYIQ